MNLTLWNLVGFEFGNTTEFSGQGGTYDAAYTAHTISGRYAFRSYPTTTGTGYCYLGRRLTDSNGGTSSNNTSSGAMHYGFWFRVNNALPSAQEVIGGLASTGPSSNWIFLGSDGYLRLYSYSTGQGGTLYGTSATALVPDKWYHIEVFKSSLGGGHLKLWLDKVLQIDASPASSVNGAGADDRVYLGKAIDVNGASVDFVYDDFFWFDGTNGNPVGPVKLSMMLPYADSTYDTGFSSGGTGTTYLEVDEGPWNVDDGTTYLLSTSSPGDAYCAKLRWNTAGATIEDIVGVVGLCWHRGSGSLTSYNAIRLRVGADYYDTPTEAGSGNVWVARGIALAETPQGSKWTKEHLDALEVGMVTTASVTGPTQLSAVFAYVGWVPFEQPTSRKAPWVHLPGRRSAQPTTAAEVDWSHPHNQGLLGWWTFNDGRFRDISGLNRNVTLFGSGPHFVNTPVGIAYANNGTASKYISAPLSYPAIGTGPWAGEIVFSINAFKNYNGLMFAETSSTLYYDIDFYSGSTGYVGIHRDWYSRAISAGRFYHYLVTRTQTGTGNGASYLNGVRVVHNFVEDMNTAITAVLFGTYAGTGDWLNGTVLYGRLLNRHVTPDEASERYAAWWQGVKSSRARSYSLPPIAGKDPPVTVRKSRLIATQPTGEYARTSAPLAPALILRRKWNVQPQVPMRIRGELINRYGLAIREGFVWYGQPYVLRTNKPNTEMSLNGTARLGCNHFGRAIVLDGGNGWASFADTSGLNLGDGAKLTVLTRHYWPTTGGDSSYQALLSMGNYSGDSWAQFQTTAGYLRFYRGAANTQDTTAIQRGSYIYSAIYCGDNPDESAFVTNGSATVYPTGGGSGGSFQTNVHYGPTNNAYQSVAACDVAAVFKAKLSIDDMKEFCKNPYGFLLEPAPPQRIYVGA